MEGNKTTGRKEEKRTGREKVGVRGGGRKRERERKRGTLRGGEEGEQRKRSR